MIQISVKNMFLDKNLNYGHCCNNSIMKKLKF